MHSLFLLSLVVAWRSIFVASQAEDIFSSNPSISADIASSLDLFISNTEQTNSDLNDPSSNPTELIFDSSNLGYYPNVPITDLDSSTIFSNDEFVGADPLGLALLESSCQVEGNGQINDVLRTRDAQACRPDKTENYNFGTDSWWRRVFPPRKPSSQPGPSPIPGVSDPQNVPQIGPDTFRGFFQEINEEKRCPKEFPIRCCSGYLIGYRGQFQYRTIYFISTEDCVPILDIEECPLTYDACCQNPGPLNIYYCIIMGYDPLSFD